MWKEEICYTWSLSLRLVCDTSCRLYVNDALVAESEAMEDLLGVKIGNAVLGDLLHCVVD